MNTNEKICKWLGLETRLTELTESGIMLTEAKIKIRGIETWVYISFLTDRNQQKWIEDKITEKYYLQYYTVDNNKWVVLIEERFSPPDYEPLASGMDESKDLAFISAVEQLIDKETNKT